MKPLSFSLCDTAAIVATVAERAPRAGYPMSLTGAAEIDAVTRAVNQGIDSHLEACYVPARGDSYVPGDRSIVATETTPHWREGDKLTIAVTLECHVSAESLPVLVRRLLEDDAPETSSGEGAMLLASSICGTLGIDCV